MKPLPFFIVGSLLDRVSLPVLGRQKYAIFMLMMCIPILFLKTPIKHRPKLLERWSVQGRISNSFLVLLPADGLYALSFSISSLTLIGMLAVITYTVSWDLRQLFNVASFVYLSFICTVINASFRRDYFQILLSKED